MVFIPVGFGLALHVLFWGFGGAWLLTPRPWRRYWPLFCAPVGLALQSAVVWTGAYAGLPGTDSYSAWAWILPLVLGAVAVWRAGFRRLWTQIGALAGPIVAVAIVLAALLLPMEQASSELTTSSLGSCDAADYAAGARVLQEFARGDRTGFLGLTEVVSVASVDNFYDFWLRLNHFTPSALIAFNGSALGLEPYQITSAMSALFLALSLPVVFWLARAGFRYGPAASLWIAVIYGFNPLSWYAVAHVAMGQLLAAHAIALLTWLGIALWRGSVTARRGIAFCGLLAVVWWLLLGAYNFIVPVALVPAISLAGGSAISRRQWRRLAGWVACMLAPLALCGVVFADRVLGLAERYRLFGDYDFGWKIPGLTPEGWLGAVAGTDLSPLSGMWTRLLLGGALVALLALAIWRSRKAAVYLAASVTLPVVVGYAYLEFRGARLGTNASYDAYKLLSVFFPGILASLCLWTTLFRGKAGWARNVAVLAAVAVTYFNGEGTLRFMKALRRPPLTVDQNLVQLQQLEARAEVASINMQIPDMWSRLWANAFLLRKPQYFPTHTYEGRRNTELRGAWDLLGGVIEYNLPAGGTIVLNSTYQLMDTRSPYRLAVRFGEGWYDLERSARDKRRWRWTSGEATLHVENAGSAPIRTSWRLRGVTSLAPRLLHILVDGEVRMGVEIDGAGRDVFIPELVVPPGGVRIALVTGAPLDTPRGDTRGLAFQVFNIEVKVAASAGVESGRSALSAVQATASRFPKPAQGR